MSKPARTRSDTGRRCAAVAPAGRAQTAGVGGGRRFTVSTLSRIERGMSDRTWTESTASRGHSAWGFDELGAAVEMEERR